MNWTEFYKEESKKPYFETLISFLEKEYKEKNIYPKKELIYNAFKLTPLNNVKIVIIGQDPYQTPGYAMGLAFSVNKGIMIPKSLINIYKEINAEFGYPIPSDGDLSFLAQNGVLLLNRILTVEDGKPLSHKNKGWETFTDNAIKRLEEENRKMVYILLGREAGTIKPLITNPLHRILETSHPSPLGAYKGFFGSNVFKDACDYLDESYEIWRKDEKTTG